MYTTVQIEAVQAVAENFKTDAERMRGTERDKAFVLEEVAKQLVLRVEAQQARLDCEKADQG